MIVRCGLSIAASMRAVISARVHVEPAVDRGDHEIEPGEHGLVEVDPAVLQDVGLDTLEHPDALEPAVHLVDLVRLAREVAGLEAAGVRGRLAVVGDADVLVARRAAGQRQLLDRVGAVGVARVAVEKAAQVAALEQAAAARGARRPRSRPGPRAARAGCSRGRAPRRSAASSGVGTNALPRQSAAPLRAKIARRRRARRAPAGAPRSRWPAPAPRPC